VFSDLDVNAVEQYSAEIVEQLNTLFDDTADADRVAIYNILGKMAESEDLQEQAKANNAAQFRRQP
jgi:hypothetical protein